MVMMAVSAEPLCAFSEFIVYMMMEVVIPEFGVEKIEA